MKNVKIYLHTKFRQRNSIRGRDITVRFLKTNGRHIEILLPVSILTFPSSSVCNSASAHQISSKSDYRRPSGDVLAIFKWRPKSQIYFRFQLW